MEQSTTSDLFRSLELVKQQSSLKPMRICQCPCNKEIQQNQRIIALQTQLNQSVQLENYRRNEERLYLEAEIKQLKLQLQQPYKQKLQFLSKIQHYEKQNKKLQKCLRQIQGNFHQKKHQVNELQRKLMQSEKQNKQLSLQSQYESKLIKHLKQKIKQMCSKINKKIDKQQKVDISKIQKKNDKLEDILDRLDNKWQQYAEQIKIKTSHQIEGKTQKIQRQNKKLNSILVDNQVNIHQLKEQIQQLKEQNLQMQGKYLAIQKQLKHVRDNKDSIQENQQARAKITRLENIVISLQKKLLYADILSSNLKSELQRYQQQQKRLTKKKQTSTQQTQTQDQIRKSNQQTLQSSKELQSPDQKMIISTRNELQRLAQQIKEKDDQINQLHLKIQSLQKINDLYKQKNKQISQNRQKMCQNNEVPSSQKQQVGLNSFILNTVLTQYSHTTEQIKKSISEMEIKMKQKDEQIQSLEEANSNLKKMRIQSLQISSKLSALQKQNFQLKRKLGNNNNQNSTLTKSRIAKSQANFNFSQGSSKKSLQSRPGRKATLVIETMPKLHDRSYFSHYKKQDLNHSSADSQVHMNFLHQIQKDASLSYQKPKDTQNEQKLKIRRNATHQSETSLQLKSPCKNVRISVPSLEQRGSLVDQINVQY